MCLTAETYKEEYPNAYRIINEQTYVDDVIAGNQSEEERDLASEELKLCMVNGGFKLKPLSASGKDPEHILSMECWWFNMVHQGRLHYAQDWRVKLCTKGQG